MGRIAITTETKDDLLALGLSLTSVWRAQKRGWYTIEYHKRHDPEPRPELIDVAMATRACYHCYKKYFGEFPHHKDDLIGSAMLRIVELSGKSTEFSFIYVVAKNAMRDYIKKLKIKHEIVTDLTNWA